MKLQQHSSWFAIVFIALVTALTIPLVGGPATQAGESQNDKTVKQLRQDLIKKNQLIDKLKEQLIQQQRAHRKSMTLVSVLEDALRKEVEKSRALTQLAETNARRALQERQRAELSRKQAELAQKEAVLARQLAEQNLLKAKQDLGKQKGLLKQLIDCQRELQALRIRNKALLDQIKELQRAAPIKAKPPGADQPNPPKAFVKGVVKMVKKNIVQISIGSDQGLKVGHTLEVFRVRPRAEYLGMIRIIRVNARTATGVTVPTGRFGTPRKIAVGDSVASRIQPR